MTADLDFIQDCWTPRGVDEVHYRRLYAENRGRLFSSEGSKTLVHVLRVLLDGQGKRCTRVVLDIESSQNNVKLTL